MMTGSLTVAWRSVVAAVVFVSLAAGLSAAEPKVVFQDDLAGELGEGWSWIREHADYWRTTDKGLEIRVEPGVAPTVKNALVRKAPDRAQGTYAIEVTVTNLTRPIQQYEQAGITWYHGGKPVFKLVKELINGELYIIPGKKPMDKQSVRLRLVVTADSFSAQYRPEGEKQFKVAAKGKLPPPGADQVSIQCYNGPPEAEHWIRFSDFEMTKLSD
jgi:hypothetical protein